MGWRGGTPLDWVASAGVALLVSVLVLGRRVALLLTGGVLLISGLALSHGVFRGAFAPGPAEAAVLSAYLLVAAAVLPLTLVRRLDEAMAALQAAWNEVRKREERYVLATHGAAEGIWDWDLVANRIHYAPRWKAIIGYGPDELGDSPAEWFGRIHPADLPRVRRSLRQHLCGEAAAFEQEYRMRHRNGDYRWVHTRGVAVRGHGGKPLRMAGSHADITARKAMEERLEYAAFHDVLTGLANRSLFVEQLGRAIARAHRTGRAEYGVLFLDLDRFKLINDTLGHIVGDRVIAIIAERLAAGLPRGDLVARLGGDEFTVLVQNVRNRAELEARAAQVAAIVRQPVELEGHTFQVEASIGLVPGRMEYARPEQVLRDADIAMYDAKAQGGGVHAVFSIEMRARVESKLRLEGDLRRAVERDELEVFLQPLVDLRMDTLWGFESLVRWKHPDGRYISPAVFVPYAEESGLVHVLDEWMLEHTAQIVAQWRRDVPAARDLRFCINVSSHQFGHTDVVSNVRAVLERHGLPGRALVIEVTESALLDDEDVTRTLLELQAMQVEVKIDDFGTGYSSLSYLHRLPVSSLKVDRRFVVWSSESPRGEEMIRAIVALANNLNMTVVAEGIETREQLGLVRRLGCHYGQGYLFARPMPAPDARAYVERAATRGMRVRFGAPPQRSDGWLTTGGVA